MNKLTLDCIVAKGLSVFDVDCVCRLVFLKTTYVESTFYG